MPTTYMMTLEEKREHLNYFKDEDFNKKNYNNGWGTWLKLLSSH